MRVSRLVRLAGFVLDEIYLEDDRNIHELNGKINPYIRRLS